MEKSRVNINNITYALIIILLFFLSIKKGGFYISDSFLFNIYAIALCVFNIFYNVIISKIYNLDYYILKNKKGKIDKVFVCMCILCLAYVLPIIFSNCTNLEEAFFEFIRYVNILLIYLIIKNSKNKKIFIKAIVIINFILCLIGIDQISGKYMLRLLGKFNSGYLTLNNATRMSSTIQYANVFALLCQISYFLVLEKRIEEKENNFVKFNLRYLFLEVLSFTFLSSLILSGSRYTLLLLICTLTFFVIINKKNYILNLLLYDFVIAILYSSIINIMQYKNVLYIYFLYVLFNFANLIIRYFITKIKLDNKLNGKKQGVVFTAFIMYVILGLCIYAPINLSYSDSSQNKISRNIYNVKNNAKLHINLIQNEEDTRYNIEINKIKYDNSLEKITNFYYFSSPNSTYDLLLDLDDNDKGINIIFNIQKGSIKIDNINLDGKKTALDYLLLPTDLLYRIKDSFYVKNSLNERIYFVKDALKIIFDNMKNFFIGTGGEGFKNLYENYKTYNYHSTEVHNVYIQIFVESGVIGFTSFLLINILLFKNSNKKIVIFMFLLHFLFELDFSYLFIMCVYIIIATCYLKEES